MKKQIQAVLFLFGGIALVIISIYFGNEPREQEKSIVSDGYSFQTESEVVADEFIATWDGETSVKGFDYVYLIEKNISTENLKLIPNFENKKATSDFSLTGGCKLLVNGGFYDANYKPLGWFVSERKEISGARSSNLFNGFVSISADFSLKFGFQKPEGEILYGLQSGPMLIFNGQPLKLSMVRDKNARRLVMVEDRNGRVSFIFFYSKLSDQLGPFLSDLPTFVMQSSLAAGVEPKNAINLDGGSASVFWNGDVFLKEASTVGSWWCETIGGGN